MIVFDTNVASELMKSSPDEAVLGWTLKQSSDALCSTAITVAEVRYGIERMPDGRRKSLLHEAADRVFARFGGVTLPFDAAAAEMYPQVRLSRERAGQPIGPSDAQIAAICLAADATLATRNVKDFVGTGIEVVNPWE